MWQRNRGAAVLLHTWTAHSWRDISWWNDKTVISCDPFESLHIKFNHWHLTIAFFSSFSTSISLVVDNYQNIWLNSKRYNNRLLFPLFPFLFQADCLSSEATITFVFFFACDSTQFCIDFYFVCVLFHEKWAVKPPSEIIIKLKAGE